MDKKMAAQKLAECLASHGGHMRDWYREVYLCSAHWYELRALKLARHGRLCDKCGERRTLDVHHLNYRHIFDVGLDDLQCLCRACHNEEHGKEPAKERRSKVKRRTPPKPGKKPKLSKRARRRQRSKAFRDGAAKAARGGVVKDPWKTAGSIVAQLLLAPAPLLGDGRPQPKARVPLPPESHAQGPYIPAYGDHR